jgi:hypothetical protein
MNKDSIQQNRDPIGYTKRTRRYPSVNASQVSASKTIPKSTSNNQFPQMSSSADATPEQKTEDMMLENLMRVESQINLVRYQSFMFYNDIQHLFRNTEGIVHKSLITAVVSPSIFDNIEFLKQLNTVPQVPDALRPAQNMDYQLW